jgi:hypothetical protein
MRGCETCTGGGYHGKGHFDACTEISMLATAFPTQKAAWAGQECIGS